MFVCALLGSPTEENPAAGQVLSYPAVSIEVDNTQFVLHLA